MGAVRSIGECIGSVRHPSDIQASDSDVRGVAQLMSSLLPATESDKCSDVTEADGQ